VRKNIIDNIPWINALKDKDSKRQDASPLFCMFKNSFISHKSLHQSRILGSHARNVYPDHITTDIWSEDMNYQQTDKKNHYCDKEAK